MTENSAGENSLVGTALRVTKMLFTPVALVFLAYFVWLARDDLASTFNAALLGYLLLAALAWSVFNCLAPLLAVIVFRDLGLRLRWWQALSIHVKRLPARYVPGGVWHTVGRAIDYRDLGVKPSHLTVFVIVENGLAATLALAIGGALLYVTRTHDPLIWFAGISSFIAIVAVPTMFFFINRRVLSGSDRLSQRAYLRAVFSMGGIWFVATTAFLLYVAAFPDFSGDHSQVEIGAVYLFSWGVGFLSVFAPQGVGVFEVLSSTLIQSPLSFVALTALIGGFRIVVLVADLVTWAGVHLLDTLARDSFDKN